jgi:hypothetical protein
LVEYTKKKVACQEEAKQTERQVLQYNISRGTNRV